MNIKAKSIVKIFNVSLVFLALVFLPTQHTYAQLYNIQTTTGSDGTQITTIPGAGSNTTVKTTPDGKSVITTGGAPTPTKPSGITYTLLAPIGTFFPGGSVDISNGGLGTYLNRMYQIGIAVATGLALIMIVAGGLQYVSTDSIGGKSDGKGRIQNAVVGLLLALTSYIILNQINPNILRSELKVAPTKSTGRVNTVDVQLVEGGGTVNNPLTNYPGTQGLVDNTLLDSGIIPGNNSIPGYGVSSNATKIVQAARANINTSTCFAVTEYGNKGCGYAFGKIMSDAGIGFRNLNSSSVLSTSNIYSVLASDSRFALVAVNSINGTLPGDIIISPTTPVATGHVGIIESAGAGKIISNSSGAKSIQDRFTGQRWLSFYGGKGLKTYVFRYK